jgi:hypothetical protein
MWQVLAIFFKLKGICDSQKYSFFKIFFIKWENFTTKKSLNDSTQLFFFSSPQLCDVAQVAMKYKNI